jgi:hypothetical protein
VADSKTFGYSIYSNSHAVVGGAAISLWFYEFELEELKNPFTSAIACWTIVIDK